MNKLPKVTTKPPDMTLENHPAIPLIQQKTVNKRLVIIAAAIAAWFSLNALAADTPNLKGAPPATASNTAGAHKLTFQEHIERMKSMTPAQRINERELLRQEIQNMTPGQLAEQRKDIREHWEQMPTAEREQIRVLLQEHWKDMPPKQREERRKEMREHFKDMSPEQRQQFKSDLNQRDGMSPQDGDYPGGKVDGPGSLGKG
ncbi:MAG TPA: DUF3106 domain-containing protein [Gallionella sp.]|nr:DUF3106 domain-containing protein [Gallionella sp.]